MGRSKPLLTLQGKTVIRHCIEGILGAGTDRCVVVLGRESEAIRKEICDLPVTTVLNQKEGSDMAESVHVGFGVVDNRHSGVVVALADHPLVTSDTYRTLLETHRRKPDQILIPTYHERRGHPTLFPVKQLRNYFNLCAAARQRSKGLRTLIHENPKRVTLIPVTDEGVVLDMDTKEHYQRTVAKVGR
ncbi:MAG: nucleotidyltransferase family protein [bacterium]|nr:nucleotidyltransferase family protein [bacterium]